VIWYKYEHGMWSTLGTVLDMKVNKPNICIFDFPETWPGLYDRSAKAQEITGQLEGVSL